jgi:hypothetical protein
MSSSEARMTLHILCPTPNCGNRFRLAKVPKKAVQVACNRCRKTVTLESLTLEAEPRADQEMGHLEEIAAPPVPQPRPLTAPKRTPPPIAPPTVPVQRHREEWSDQSSVEQSPSSGIHPSSVARVSAEIAEDFDSELQGPDRLTPVMSCRDFPGLLRWKETKTFECYEMVTWIIFALGFLVPTFLCWLPVFVVDPLAATLWLASPWLCLAIIAGSVYSCAIYRTCHLIAKDKAWRTHLRRMGHRLNCYLEQHTSAAAVGGYWYVFSDERIIALNSELILSADLRTRELKAVPMADVKRISEETVHTASETLTTVVGTTMGETRVRYDWFGQPVADTQLDTWGRAETQTEHHYEYRVCIDTRLPQVGRLYLVFPQDKDAANSVAGLIQSVIS